LVLACSNPTNKNGAATTESARTATPAASPAATTTVTASANQIGVPECDNFLTAYESCVTNKVPAATRAQFEAGMKTWRTEWKKLAADPKTKPSLVAACKTQLEAARTSMKAYNCTF